jgi:hypothetical protein
LHERIEYLLIFNKPTLCASPGPLTLWLWPNHEHVDEDSDKDEDESKKVEEEEEEEDKDKEDPEEQVARATPMCGPLPPKAGHCGSCIRLLDPYDVCCTLD